MVNQNLDNLFNLSGKVALITGGNKGIGKGIAKGLGLYGAKIVIAARDKTVSKQTCEELSALNIETMSLEIDMTDQSQINPLVSKVIHKYGQIDILVNNAGTALRSSPEDITNKDWQYIMDLNLNSVYWLSKEVYPHMKSQGSGKIINIGSMYSIFGSGVVPSYSTTKGGIVQLTKSLAVGWAKDNINVKFFLTTGSIWNSDYVSSSDIDLRTSFGTSFDFITAVGPISFSYAIPIQKNNSDKTRSFNFSIGTSF